MFLEFAKKNLPRNPIIIEAGAHDGGDTMAMARLWPEGQIYAFEPSPYWNPILKNKLSAFPNITYYHSALGTTIGTTDFYQAIANNGGVDSTLKPLVQDYHWQVTSPIQFDLQPVQIPVTTLDAWAEKTQIDHVDFMWLDMQGAEGSVLTASPNILKRTAFIQAEYSERAIYEGTMLFDDLKILLRKHGFIVIGTWKSNPADVQGNALFMRIDNL